MNESDQKKKELKEQEHEEVNENAGILVDEFLKISDPNSGKVYVAKRGNS